MLAECRHVLPDERGEHLSDNIVLLSPFVADPFVGRDAVVKVLAVLHSGVDSFATEDKRAAVMLRIRC